MRILFSGLLLFFITHNSVSMLDNHSGTNFRWDLVATVPAALMLVKTALPQNVVFGMIPCLTPVGIGVQCVQLGMQLGWDYCRYKGSNMICAQEFKSFTDQKKLTKLQFQKNSDARIIIFLLRCKALEIVILGLIHCVALAYNGHCMSGKHWKGVGKHLLMTQIWSLIPLGMAWYRTRG